MRKFLKYWLSLLICIYLVPGLALAAQADSTGAHKSLKSILIHDGNAIVQDAVELAVAPVHFKGRDWLYTGAVVGGTALLFSVDQPGRAVAQRQQGRTLDDLAKFSNDNLTRTEIGPIIWLGGLVIGNESLRTAGLEMFEALTFAAALTNALKIGFGRERPYMNQGAFEYKPFHGGADWASLPSGHATAAFAMYSALAAHLHNTWASIGLYGLASVSGLARIYSDVHWTSDVFLGAAIGTVIGNAVVHMHEKRDAASGWEVGLTPGGVKVALRF
jgi:membrane-associated phospholipid phosphatase